MKLQRPQRTQKTPKLPKMNKKLSKQQIFTMVASVVLILAHIAILLAILWSWRYYSIYPSIFGSLVAIVLCILIIIDIVFFVGFNHHDMALKIISTVLAVLLMIGGTFGSAFLARTNSVVDSVLDDGKSDKYETFSGVFVCYDKNNKFSSLSDLSGKRVGMLVESTNGLTYIANNLLSKEKIDFATIDYKTNAEMLQGLIDGNVDAIVITSGYRNIFATKEGAAEDEASPFDKYLENMIDFYSFEEELKVDSNRKQKNLGKDPFNVLLIGYSRTDIGSTVGLADSIILATVNPQTYTVSMMSIARDSFVPISCYGGELDKINSGRSTSRACFIETVEKFIGMDIDYYMELDYLGLVQIVNTIGGVKINNPVDFELDGIYVPAGSYVADGQQALQFCRERHHMPNGDFDRQQHQKEVIIAIAKKFIESGDVTLALNAMDAASDWMSTDLTLTQLTNVFNMLLKTKNYTSLKTFDLVDFHTLRITGLGGIMYYSMSMRLPLWVYLIYQGSYDESIQHVKDIMGNYTTMKQDNSFEFSAYEPYIRAPFYSTEYENKFLYEPDPMPPYWANLEGMAYAEALAWAGSNGVSLTTTYILPGDANYKAEEEGLVVAQSPRYGALISEYKSGSVTVMGNGTIDESKQVPNFVGHSYSKAIDWCNNYGVYCDIDFNTSVSGDVGKVVSQNPSAGTSIDDISTLKIVVKAGTYKITFNSNGQDVKVPDPITVKTGDDSVKFQNLSDIEKDNGDIYLFLGWFTAKEGGDQVTKSSQVSGNVTVYAHWEKKCAHEWGEWKVTKEATCEEAGSRTRECTKCKKVETEEIEALGHDWGDTVQTTAPTCTEPGSGTQTCKRNPSHTRTVSIDPLGHDWGEWTTVTPPTCEAAGSETRTCSRNSEHTDTREIPQLSGEACSTGSGSNTNTNTEG